MDNGGAGSPFPPRGSPAVRVDSVGEEYAYVVAWPAYNGAWERVSQILAPGAHGPEDHLTLRSPDGVTAVVRFAIGSFFGRSAEPGATPGQRVMAAMRAGHELARAEGPLHPGTTPLYPLPAPSHAGSVAVPLPIVGVDAGRRGLYAPPRIAVVRWPSAVAVGVGDAPGFDPRRWPPSFLGDWPPPTVLAWDTTRRAGVIERFTAIWGRLLDVRFGGEDYPERVDEMREARHLLNWLVPPPMRDLLAELSPDFWRWVGWSEIEMRAPEGRVDGKDSRGQTP
jgi:hypothetical protein